MLLDLIEVAKSHTGVNLGIAFMNVLKNFGVEDKVRSVNSCQRVLLTYVAHVLQILSITGDNASNNDLMIQYLGNALDDFPGPTNQTRCFVHTVNLIAKSILKPFDTQKTNEIRSFNDVAHALADLAEGLDSEDSEGTEDTTGDDKEGAKDNSDKEDTELGTTLEPIRSMLLKVCLCFIVCNPKLSSVQFSYANLHLRSRTQRQFSFQPGTRYCQVMAFPHV